MAATGSGCRGSKRALPTDTVTRCCSPREVLEHGKVLAHPRDRGVEIHRVGVDRHHTETVGRHPPDDVRGAERSAQTVSHCHDRPLALQRAEEVLDALHVVDTEVEHRERSPAALGPPALMLDEQGETGRARRPLSASIGGPCSSNGFITSLPATLCTSCSRMAEAAEHLRRRHSALVQAQNGPMDLWPPQWPAAKLDDEVEAVA
jgi:hypothetical protein